MIPIVPPLRPDPLDEEAFYALGEEPYRLRLRLQRLWAFGLHLKSRGAQVFGALRARHE